MVAGSEPDYPYQHHQTTRKGARRGKEDELHLIKGVDAVYSPVPRDAGQRTHSQLLQG